MWIKHIHITGILIGFTIQSWSQPITFFRTYGSGAYDAAESILQCADNGFIVVGATSGYNVSGSDVLVFRTDSVGNQIWMKTYGGAGNEWAKCIVQVPGSSDYMIVGHTNSFGAGQYDFYLLRIKQNGDTVWTKTYGGMDWDFAYHADTTSDGNIVIVGETSSFGAGNKDAYVIKIDPNGTVLWMQTIGGMDDDMAAWIFEDRDFNLIVAGSTQSYGAGMRDYYLIKLNASGDTIFTKTYGTANDEWFTSGDIYYSASNNLSYCIGGNIYYPVEDIVVESLNRIDSNGVFMYATQGNPANQYERQNTIVRNEDAGGKFYVINTFKDNAFASYDINFRRTYYAFGGYAHNIVFGSGSDEFSNDVRKTSDKGYVIAGRIDNYGPGSSACFIAKTDSLGSTATTPVIGIDENKLPSIRIYPNPANENIHIELPAENLSVQLAEIVNMQGITFISCSSASFDSNNTISISLSGMTSGAYFIRLYTDTVIYTYRFIIAN